MNRINDFPAFGDLRLVINNVYIPYLTVTYVTYILRAGLLAVRAVPLYGVSHFKRLRVLASKKKKNNNKNNNNS